MTETPTQADPSGTAAPTRRSRKVLTAVNATIRELTTKGLLDRSKAAHVELAKVLARQLDGALDAGHGGEVVRLTKELRGLLVELEPRGARRDGPAGADPRPAVGSGPAADLDTHLRAGPTMGNTA